MVYSNNFGQTRVGVRVVTQVVNAVDADATAFIAAAGITNLTQAAAISTLVNDLKTYGLWTKMKALYPFVGGSATSHKFNLKDPRDLDAAFRLTFNGGWTHNSNGVTPNGSNGFSRTFFVDTNLSINLSSYSIYNRTNTIRENKHDFGYLRNNSNYVSNLLAINYPGIGTATRTNSFNRADYSSQSNYAGFYNGNRNNSSNFNLCYNGSKVATTTESTSGKQLSGYEFYLGCLYLDGSILEYSTNNYAFASIGDGLTDTEAANFYTSVQKFQTTLGRQVGTPVVSDSDATAFISAAGITNNEQANAVNTLVTDLKTAGIWTKMKAIYPFVGGTATSHKFNLKDPRDVDAAFRLQFNGGWTHSSTGAKPNGTTAYANTYLNPYVVFGGGNPLLPTNSTHQLVHISKYSRTNSTITDNFDGVYTGSYPNSCWLGMGWNSGWAPNGAGIINTRSTNPSSVSLGNRTDGFFVVNRDGYTSLKSFRNSVLVSTDSTESRTYNEINQQLNLNPQNVYLIGALNTAYDLTFRPLSYNNYETSFQSIGTSLTDAEATAFYNAVQKFNTTLGRQIGTPVLPDGQIAKLLDSYTGAAAAYSLRKLRTAYSGYAIRVRRSSDNLEQDISFDTNGNLDTYSLLAFVGSGNGFVTTWYDQSGSSNNAVQTTSLSQPQIVSSGALLMINNKPSLYFNGSNTMNLTQINYSNENFSVQVMNKINSSDKSFALAQSSGPGFIMALWSDSKYYLQNRLNTYLVSQTTYNDLNQVLLTGDGTSTNNTLFKNGSQIATNTITTDIIYNTINSIGNYYSNITKNNIQEVIFYNSNKSTSRTSIESNINTYYSIY